MRAVVVERTGAPDVMSLQTVETPTPRAHEVSIDVSHSGVGFVDTLFRSGAVPFATPFIPGIEVTGTVREVGARVTSFAPGQPVAALLNDFGRTQRAGGYAEVAVAHEQMCASVPPDADPALLTAALANGVTAWIALRHIARVEASDSVMVLGAGGGLGGTTARIAALLACRDVIGVVSEDATRAPSQCTRVVLTEELPSFLAASTQPLAVVVDTVGGQRRKLTFEHLAPLGRQVILGDASGQDEHFSGDAVWFGTRTVAGLNLAGIADVRPDLVQDALETVVRLVSRGLLAEPEPTLVPLDEVRSVHQSITDRTAPAKTVLLVQ